MVQKLNKLFRRYFPLIMTAWILFVLYPNPLSLIIGIQRLSSPDIDPGAVEIFAEDCPAGPADIEKWVFEKIPYAYDWETYQMPWYFPTIKEVLERKQGDCKARAIILASVLENKGIPYRFNFSIRHMWIEYENKAESTDENSELKFYQYDPRTKETSLRAPRLQWKEMIKDTRNCFWRPMPGARKALLVFGIFCLISARIILRRKGAH